ncbi:MAG: YafY family transcriptional regulator [Myxococcales bacterium]|nr:YafY family transcriptional regulator [Myxococcales bacterium]
MRRADRLFQLVQLLRSRRLATADFLADALGVSKRTVYRDIRDLERSGVPVRGEAGVGYQLERGYELPPLTFNAAEIEALVFGLRMAEAHGDPDLANGARSAMAKVAAALPAPLRALMVETPLFAPHRADRSRDCLALWRRGIAERRKLALDYVDRGGAASTRAVRPLALYFWGTCWSLAAWCELRRDYRNFRSDRVESVRLTDEAFDEADGVSLDAYLRSMAAEAAAGGWPELRGFDRTIPGT